MRLPEPPEGILDPQIPWSYVRPQSPLWNTLKARLTGRPTNGEHYSSYVSISEADADRLIENLKKDPRGYPSLDQTSGTPIQWMERQQKYQEWLVEEYLENPFREETNKKIEEAEIQARLNEIQEQKKKDEAPVPVVPDVEEEEQKILDTDQQAIENQVEEITTELDSVEEEEKQEKQDQERIEKPEEQPEQEPSKLNSDIESISDSLVTIKGALSNQISDLGSVEKDLIKASSSLEAIKQLFQAQTDIIKREIDLAEKKSSEKQLEQSKVVSSTLEATDLTAGNKAEGVIESIDGPTLTVKTTEGEFRQGEKISQGGGGGLFDMLAGIAGKFLTRGKGGGGGGGSPIKMSAGGFLNTPYPANSGTLLTPGVYDKPTKGNLAPGQAVIPLNRNYGKRIFEGNLTQTLKLQQPLADVMAQPLKAIGLSIISVAGNFLRLLGPLAGFFTPYISGLVKGFGAVLGVPVAIITALLGGPAYAAMEDQDQQQNTFAELWADLMEKFGFDFGEGDKKRKRKKKDGDGSDPDVGPIEDGPMFEKGARIAKKLQQLLSIEDYQAAAIVGNLIQESSLVPDRIQGSGMKRGPLKVDGVTGYSYPQWTSADRQQKFADYMESKGHDWRTRGATDELATGFVAKEFKDYMSSVFTGTKNVAAASNWVLKNYEKPADQGPAEQKERATDSNSVLSKMTAEEGVQIKVNDNSSMGKFLGWSIVEGPNSGYDVGSNLEMHGKEAYLQHENGISILPIENNEYSLSKNPDTTINRWKEILGTKNPSSDETSFAAGGVMDIRRANLKRLKDKQRPLGTKAKIKGKEVYWAGSNFGWQRLNTSGRSSTMEALNAPSVQQRFIQDKSPSAPRQKPSFANITSRPSAKPKEKSETDLMMEQYNKLVAAGKHAEAKDLGMQIWNKTYRKTDIGIERIPTTQTQAADATAKPNKTETNIIVPSPPPTLMVPVSGGSMPQPPVVLPSIQEELEIVNMKSLC